MSFKLIDSNRFFLEGTSQRFLHLASIHYGLREFMCFSDQWTQQVYIEEISGGSLERIEDDSLAESLAAFLTEVKVLDIGRPTLPDNKWLKKNEGRSF